MGIEPDPWQADILRTESRQILVNCARQTGKSTTAALKGAHAAVHRRGSLALLVSPSQRQSAELFRKVRGILRAWPEPLVFVEDNLHSCQLANESRVISLPATEDTVRGYSAPTLIIEDEAGDVPDDLYQAIRPMLAVSRGQLILQGTPKGQRGHFWSTWQRATTEDLATWARVQIPATLCPRISAEFLAEERLALGSLYAQEYECAFLRGGGGLVYDGFSDAINLIDALPQRRGWTKILALDFGIVDRNAVALLAWREHDPCLYVERCYRFAGDAVAVAHEVLPVYEDEACEQIIGDVGGMGKAFQSQLGARHHLPIVPAKKHDKLGNISLFNGDLRRGRIKVVRGACTDLVSEWNTLPWADDRLFGKQEAHGFANHCADAVLYGWRASRAFLERPERQKPQTPAEQWKKDEKRMLEREYQQSRRKPWQRPLP